MRIPGSNVREEDMDIHEKIDRKEAERILKEHRVLNDESLGSFVSLQHIGKLYPNGVKAVYDFNLEIEAHDFVALVGPSGCGKSTTLRMIAGLEEISEGSLFIDKKYSNFVPSKDRDIAMVFQSYALYPQKNVYENIAFGLKIRHVDKAEIKKRVFEVADILDLGNYLDRYPRELSGGQMQRVALGRAIVRQAKLFLMDEPLSNLDAKLRVTMRSEIVRIHKEVGATTIYVTHDQTEAMTMANKIVVMNKGFVQQIGKPIDVYNHPNNLFVATFIGSPSMNILSAVYRDGSIAIGDECIFSLDEKTKKQYLRFYAERVKELSETIARFDEFGEEEMAKIKSAQIYVKGEKTIRYEKRKHASLLAKLKEKRRQDNYNSDRGSMKLELEEMLKNARDALKGDHEIALGIRPEHFRYADETLQDNFSEIIEFSPDLVELLGSEYIVHGKKFGSDISVKINGGAPIENGKMIHIAIDLDKVHLFDLDSGLAIS